jgi:hypothetical protein
MNYQAFTDEALLMMHFSTRGALAVDDELARLGAERRFHVRGNSDWRKHADDLEAEMRRRNISFEAIDWQAIQDGEGVAESAPLQPDGPRQDRGSSERGKPSGETEDGHARLQKRIATFIKTP